MRGAEAAATAAAACAATVAAGAASLAASAASLAVSMQLQRRSEELYVSYPVQLGSLCSDVSGELSCICLNHFARLGVCIMTDVPRSLKRPSINGRSKTNAFMSTHKIS